MTEKIREKAEKRVLARNARNFWLLRVRFLMYLYFFSRYFLFKWKDFWGFRTLNFQKLKIKGHPNIDCNT